MEKPLRGKPNAGFPLRLEIPHSPRDFHFPTAAAAVISLPPSTTTPSPSASFHSSISISLGGYDVSRLFQTSPKNDTPSNIPRFGRTTRQPLCLERGTYSNSSPERYNARPFSPYVSFHRIYVI